MPKVIILGSSNAIPTKGSENTHMVLVGKERMVLNHYRQQPHFAAEKSGFGFLTTSPT